MSVFFLERCPGFADFLSFPARPPETGFQAGHSRVEIITRCHKIVGGQVCASLLVRHGSADFTSIQSHTSLLEETVRGGWGITVQ